MKKEITKEQVGGIKVTQRLGIAMAREYGEELAEEYREGRTALEIARKYFPEHIEINEEITEKAVDLALEEILGVEKRNLGLAHIKASSSRKGKKDYINGTGIFSLRGEEKSKASRRAGNLAYEKKAGVHGMSHEEHVEYGRKSYEMGVGVHAMTKEEMRERNLRNYSISLGKLTFQERSETGKKVAEENRKNKKAIFGLTPEQLSEAGKKAGIKGGKISAQKAREKSRGFFDKEKVKILSRQAILARGFIPWSDEEKHDLWNLANKTEYIHQKGVHREKPNSGKISSYLNKKYHEGRQVRNALKTWHALKYMRDKLEF